MAVAPLPLSLVVAPLPLAVAPLSLAVAPMLLAVAALPLAVASLPLPMGLLKVEELRGPAALRGRGRLMEGGPGGDGGSSGEGGPEVPVRSRPSQAGVAAAGQGRRQQGRRTGVEARVSVVLDPDLDPGRGGGSSGSCMGGQATERGGREVGAGVVVVVDVPVMGRLLGGRRWAGEGHGVRVTGSGVARVGSTGKVRAGAADRLASEGGQGREGAAAGGRGGGGTSAAAAMCTVAAGRLLAV